MNDKINEAKGILNNINDDSTDQEINEAYNNLMSLTPEQEESVINAAEDMRKKDPDAILLEKIQNGEIKPDTSDLKTVDGFASIDPASGKVRNISYEAGGDEDIDIDDLLNDEIGDIEDIKLDENDIKGGIKAYNLEDIDADSIATILELSNRYQNGDTRIRYDELPSIIKSMIAKTIMEKNNSIYTGTKDLKDRMARSFIHEVTMEALSNKAQTIFVDMGNAINNYTKKEMSKSISSVSISHDKMFREKFLEFADKAEKEGKTEDAQKLRDVSAAYIEAHTLKSMYDIYAHTGKIKVKKFDLEKPDKVYQSMRDKYAKTKLNIKDVKILEPILDRHLPEYIDMDDIKALLIIFCKYCMNMSPSNIAEHTFMYYFIYNICMLDICDENNEESVKFKDETIKNITRFIELIRKKMGKE